MLTTRLLIGAATLVASILVACDAAAPVYYDADYTGRPYPPECRRDLSHLTVPVTFVPREKLYEINQAAGGAAIAHTARLDGLHVRYLDGTSAIYVAEELGGWMRRDVIHHERCHEVAGSWHS